MEGIHFFGALLPERTFLFIGGYTMKLIKISFIFIILFTMFVGLGRTFFFPTDINLYENRYAEKVTTPTLTAVEDHIFQDSIEDALADQIPYAQDIKRAYNISTSAYLDSILSPILRNINGSYVPYNSLYIFGEDQLVFPPMKLDELTPSLDKKATSLNKTFKKHSDIEFFIYYIEKDTDIDFETKKKLGAREYLFDKIDLPKTNLACYEINDYDTFRAYFYKTDHHWNNKGSYTAYTDLLKFLNVPEEPLQPIEEVSIDYFSGAKAATVGATNFTEEFVAYKFDFPTMSVSIDGVPVADYGQEDAFYTDAYFDELSYGGFYGADNGEVAISTGNSEKENILLIGDSFDNAIIKLLATHYNNTYAVDLRNYEHFNGQPFDFSGYIEKNEIDKVLIIGNIDYFVMDTFNLEN